MSSPVVHLYDLKFPDRPRWIPGDQYPRILVRNLLRPWRGRPPGGLAKVTKNLCLGLERIGQPYRLHAKSELPQDDSVIGILHGPLDEVRRIAQTRRCVTGVGVLDFPDQWPLMFRESKVVFHLQACEWAAAYYQPFYGDRLRLWPVGIETDRYVPLPHQTKELDFLVYDKLRWPDQHPEPDVLARTLAELDRRNLKYQVIGYGRYPRGKENTYHALLARSRALLFLCENETQGIAYNEALSMGVPILAWNPRQWLDPMRHRHSLSHRPASSIPYWDERCGEEFPDLKNMPAKLDLFCEKQRSGGYDPRSYILETLTLERCAQRYLDLLREASSFQC